MCPLGGRFMDGKRQGRLRGHLVCHCLLIESESGLVLVDTGIGLWDIRDPRRLSPLFRKMMGVQLEPERTAFEQVKALGFSPTDVRHIILTHLDFDHAGGIQDFPQADVHVMAAEYEAAHDRPTPIDRRRYCPEQWQGTNRWHRYDVAGEPWLGFSCVRQLQGLPPEILLVPLVGHTRGHAGVAVQTSNDWLLHAGDAYFFYGEMDTVAPWVTPGLAAYQRMMEVDREARLHNQDRLRRVSADQGERLRVFCAHDVTELDAQRTRNRLAAARGAERLNESRTSDRL